MDLTTLTLSVLVTKINRSNSSGDGFYTVHQCPSIGLTSVHPDANYNCVHTLGAGCSGARRSRSTCCCRRAGSELASLWEQLQDLSRHLSFFFLAFGGLCEKQTSL